MDGKEHPYAMPDSTVVSLRLLCGQDFTDAVPFTVTEMWSPTSTGKFLFEIFLHIRVGSVFKRKREPRRG